MANFYEVFKPSFFTRLYISIIFAVIFSSLLTILFVENIMEQDAIDDFAHDTHYIYTEISQQIPSAEQQELTLTFPSINGLIIDFQPLNAAESVCETCVFITKKKDAKIFKFENGFLAVYDFPNLSYQLIISDADTLDEDDEIEKMTGLTIEEAIFVLYSAIVLLVLFLTLYWPVRLLQKQINGLVHTTQTFGAGQLNIRADEVLTKPLNNLARSFNIMASSISDTVKENQIFAQAVPHEIRTPLSRIQLAAGLLSKNNENEQQLALLENIDTYIEDIDELIGQVVAFSKLNSILDEDESNFYQSINFASFINARLQTIKLGNNINIEVDIEPALEITTNPVYLRLLIDNLLKNAFSHSQKCIKVCVKSVHDHIELYIEDDGPGVPVEFQETIFFPFARLDKSRSRKTGGLGLGLAIAKAACKRMNSELSVKNNSFGGACFIVRFF